MSVEKIIIGMFLALGCLPVMTFFFYKLIPSLFISYICSIVIFTIGGIILVMSKMSQSR
jgi:hypothetical protein